MTRIDFHSNVPDRMTYACRLVRKARAAAVDSRIIVLLKNSDDISNLDRTLWTFSEQDFLPHAIAGDELAKRSPIVLTDDVEAVPHQDRDILINLTDEIPAAFAQFERVCEIVSTGAADTEAARERYAYYRQRGYSLTHTAVSQS